MVNMNTLFRKGYLLAVVMMAANIFIVNEMKASNKKDGNEIEIIDVDQDSSINTGEKASPLKNGLKFVLTFENYFNFFGTLALSVANNYTKWWDYNPGWYGQFGCFGWKSKRFLYDVVQFEFNFNLGRGALWSFIHIMNRIKTSGKVKINNNFSLTSFFLKDILRGFTSMPLTFHISNFSISFSLDSIIWAGVDYISKPSGEKEVNKGEEPKDDGNDLGSIENNNIDYKSNDKPKESESNTNPDNA